MTQLKVYTREPSEIYPDGLARSVHMSLLNEAGVETPLNRITACCLPRQS